MTDLEASAELHRSPATVAVDGDGSAGGDPCEDISPPSRVWLLLEGYRAAGELVATLARRDLAKGMPSGDGHPVLLLPGFLASDLSTRPLRHFLRELGYQAHRWKLGRNLGASEELEARLEERLDELYHRHGRKISLVGWSLGGVYARLLANRHSEHVRSVISLGSPFGPGAKANHSWRLYEWITKGPIDEIPEEKMDEVRRTPPVPTTSILSRSDGIVAWQCSLQREELLAETVEVRSSHLGLGFNSLVLYAIADRLMQPEGEWRPFFRQGVDHPPGLQRPAEARPAAARSPQA